MHREVLGFCSEVKQKLRMLAILPAQPSDESVDDVRGVQERCRILLSAIVSNPIPYFT